MALFVESVFGVIGIILGIGAIALSICIYFFIKNSQSAQTILLIIITNITIAAGVQEENAEPIAKAFFLLLLVGGLWLFGDDDSRGAKVSFLFGSLFLSILIGCLMR